MPAIPWRRQRLAAVQAPVVKPGGDLDITAIRTWAVREPVSKRRYTVLRAEARNGLRGYGECDGLSAADLDAARAIVMGKPATNFELIRVLLAHLPAAQAAVNMALLDITGKAVKAPVFQLLGGPTRFKVRVMAPVYGGSTPVLRASIGNAHAYGFRAFVVPLPPGQWRNQGQAFVNSVRSRMELVRQEAGGDFVLDGGSALTPGDAASVSAALERFHLLWFDEPCAVLNLGAIRKLAAENVTPLGFGRTLPAAADFQDLLREDAVDVLRPDLARHGITQIRKLAALAEAYYVAVAPWHAGGPIATAAALHLAASLPNFFIQQIPLPEAERDHAMRVELAGKVETVTDGYAALPTGPGLGITVDEDALGRYEERAA